MKAYFATSLVALAAVAIVGSCSTATHGTSEDMPSPSGPASDGGLDPDAMSFRNTDYDTGTDAPFVRDPGDAACAGGFVKAGPVPLDMLLLLDTSFSMDFEGKWTAVKAAVEMFVTNKRFHGLGVGLQYFPARRLCDTNEYSKPQVPMGVVPDVTSGVLSALDAKRMYEGTPMVPAMQGSMDYLVNWNKLHPDHRVILVLATDGIPDESCQINDDSGMPNTLANVSSIAKSGAEAGPPILTFVIGVGSELKALNEIAKAGGTETAQLVNTSSQSFSRDFLTALSNIRRMAVPCEYTVPAQSNGPDIDPTMVNVSYKPIDKQASDFRYVGDAKQCDKAPRDGWYYDSPTKPSKVILCPQTCEFVKDQEEGQVGVVFGCRRTDVVR